MNGIIEAAFIGRLGGDADLKTSGAGKPWLGFSVAVGSGDETQWVRVVAFGELAEEFVGEYGPLHKGDRVYVEGRLQLNSWTSKSDGTERTGLNVIAWRMERLGQIGKSRPSKPKAEPGGDRRKSLAARDWQAPADDAIPF